MSTKVTLAQFIADEHERIWQDSTTKHKVETEVKLDRFTAFAGYGSRTLDTFKPKDIHRFQDHLLAVGLCKSTVNRYSSAISRVFKHAVDNEIIDKAPSFKWLKVPRSGRPKHFTDEEIKLIRKYFRGHRHSWMEHFFVLSLNTGMRRGEILMINEKDKAGNSLAFVDQDANGRWWVHLMKTKNGDERDVPLNDEAVEALKALEWRPSKYFMHRKFYNGLNDLREEVFDGDPSVVFHVCRATALTNMAERGINPYMMSKFVGHRDIQTTLRYVKGKHSALAKIADELMDDV